MAKCRNSRFIDYFLSENKYQCHKEKDYVNPESSMCDKFKAPIRAPLGRYVYLPPACDQDKT